MNLAEFSIKRRTTTLILTAVAVVGGYQAFFGLGRLEDPAFTIKDAIVTTPYPCRPTASIVSRESTNSSSLTTIPSIWLMNSFGSRR